MKQAFSFFRHRPVTTLDAAAQHIRSLRLNSQLSQAQLAEKFNIARASVSKAELAGPTLAWVAPLVYDFFGVEENSRLQYHEDNQYSAPEGFGRPEVEGE